MKLDKVNWSQACCAWHGEYAESPTVDGGVMRLKRNHEIDGILVMRFDAQNKRVDEDYVLMTPDEVEAILA